MAAYLSRIKNVRSKNLLIWMSIFFSVATFAVEDRYHFMTAAQEKQYQQLLLQIRCMVCENQSLAESNSPLAEDLRSEVYQQIMAGKTVAEIKTFLVERYGDSVLYEPPLQSNTFILWFGPGLLLLLGLGIWLYKVKK